jgi:ATP-binding cassette subfamily C exporter for protease/lipase
MYGDPALLVLDEPNSNLDDVGEAALVQAVQDLRQRGKTIVLITHRTSAIAATNKLLLLRDGMVAAFGPTNQVLQALQESNQKQVEAQRAAQQQAAAQQTAAQQAAAQQAAAQQAAAQKAASEQSAHEAEEIAAQRQMVAEQSGKE